MWQIIASIIGSLASGGDKKEKEKKNIPDELLNRFLKKGDQNTEYGNDIETQEFLDMLRRA